MFKRFIKKIREISFTQYLLVFSMFMVVNSNSVEDLIKWSFIGIMLGLLLIRDDINS